MATDCAAIEEHVLRAWIEDVRAGRLARRAFVARLAGVGLAAPFASMLLASAGVAHAQTAATYKPTRRGGGGALKLLFWQGPTLLNPHFGTGSKDLAGCHLFCEALARFDADANLVPVLAAEIPSRANGGIAADGRSTTWRLKKGVTWHDGKPFTADDVVFNWSYAVDPATAAVTVGSYRGIKAATRLDAETVRFEFDQPTPRWARAATVQLIPKHLFEAYGGARAREAPGNLRPVGTGPYRFVDFKPGDMVRGELNPGYHAANERAGWKRGSDGICEKGGRKLRLVFQTSINSVRQKVQNIYKQACAKAGVEIELKGVTAAVFFSSDAGNPDTYGKFLADLQMYAVGGRDPDPSDFMQWFVSWQAASKANKWLGQNRGRWRSDEYDALFEASERELDPVKRATLLIRMNDLVCNDHAVIPVVYRPSVNGYARNLVAPVSGWDGALSGIADWYHES